jgi:hypothetical protein
MTSRSSNKSKSPAPTPPVADDGDSRLNEKVPNFYIMSTLALSVTALSVLAAASALFLEPTRVLVLYAQNEALRLNALSLDLARLVAVLMFALGAVVFVMLGVKHAESRASMCYALAYVFFFSAVAHGLSAYLEHGSWAKGLARAPFEPLLVLYVRYYVPLGLAFLNFFAAWCDDVADDDAPVSPPPPPLPPKEPRAKSD